MELIDFLLEQFREINATSEDHPELNDEQVTNIQAAVSSELGRFIEFNDVKILYRSYYRQYWKEHTRRPYQKKQKAAA